MIKLKVLSDNSINCSNTTFKEFNYIMRCQGNPHFGFPRCPYFDSFSFEETGFCVICNYEKKTLKDKITEVIKNNKIGTEFSEHGLEIFVDSIIDIIKEDRE